METERLRTAAERLLRSAQQQTEETMRACNSRQHGDRAEWLAAAYYARMERAELEGTRA